MHDSIDDDADAPPPDHPLLKTLDVDVLYAPHPRKECQRRLEQVVYIVPPGATEAPSPGTTVAGSFHETTFGFSRVYEGRRSVQTLASGIWQPQPGDRDTMFLLEFAGIRALSALLAVLLPLLLIVAVVLLLLGIPFDFTWLRLAAVIGILLVLFVVGRMVENQRIKEDVRWYRQFFSDTIDARPVVEVIHDIPLHLPPSPRPARPPRPPRPPQPARRKRKKRRR